MRDKIECGIFSLGLFGEWIDTFIEQIHQQTDKIRLFKIDVGVFVPLDAFQVGGMSFPHPQVFHELSLVFERYDCIIIPITPETLIWTRIVLSQLQSPLKFPLVALSHRVQPIAFVDMAGKGISDYIFEGDSAIVLRVRLLNALGRQKTLLAQERLVTTDRIGDEPRQEVSSRVLSFFANLLQEEKERKRRRSIGSSQSNKIENVDYAETFQVAKARVVTEFERKYVVNALRAANGNIAVAAQRANKHRRAFWELLRKYQIDPDDYR
ncbi:hypothetical protein [Pelistega europaea]|uniref:DNA binding HTH domain-containing protein n=1 Tax=Pelistega europaea TaxID=106147 RepID=A0A7Y4P3R4_9BURK|nr:hypothetical protein [Pelistega europaea]NOL48721.1 hypothetical protein [Pelistega europaea]